MKKYDFTMRDLMTEAFELNFSGDIPPEIWRTRFMECLRAENICNDYQLTMLEMLDEILPIDNSSNKVLAQKVKKYFIF